MNYLLNRLREPSTWYGIFLILGAYGLNIDPVKQQAFMYFGMMMAGAPDIDLSTLANKIKGKVLSREVKSNDKHKSVNDLLDDDK